MVATETCYQMSVSDDAYSPQEYGMRTRQIESLARDIERFDPGSKDSNVDDYIRELKRVLLDLPNPTTREKLKLLWKTTSRGVHGFMEQLPPGISVSLHPAELYKKSIRCIPAPSLPPWMPSPLFKRNRKLPRSTTGA